MSSFFVLILCLTVIQCQDICHLIQTSGHFTGLQVYHSYPSDKLLMYKNAIQWQFDIKFGSEDNDYTLEVIPNTSQTIDSKIINMFGSYDRTSGYDCNVKYESKDSQRIVTNCTDTSIHPDTDSQYNPKSVVFKATKGDDNWLIIYDKNAPKISCYNTRNDLKNRLKDQYECRTDIPKFVNEMKRDLLESIYGVVDYRLGPLFGHILFFNINGRPKYCYQRIDKDLQCNSNEALKPLFEQCFSNQNGWPLWATIMIIVIIVTVVIVIACVWFRDKIKKIYYETRGITTETTDTSGVTSTQNTESTGLQSTPTTSTGQTSKTSDSGVKPMVKEIQALKQNSSEPQDTNLRSRAFSV